MRLLDRYIGQAVQIGVLSVIAVMLTLFALINFINEFDKIGRADYTTWLAVEYVALWLPKLAYQVFPLAALLGTMLGLGVLANHSELIVIRAAGVSKLRIAVSVIKSMLALVVLIFFVGEVIAPPAEQYAEQMRLKAMESRLSLNTEYGLWVRDGDAFIHVRSVGYDGELIGIKLAIVNDNREVVRLIRAKSARFDGEVWQLKDVTESHISHDGIKQRHLAQKPWKSLLDPEMVETVSFNPDSLSIWNQLEYIDYLRNNGLNYRIYELAMWNRIISPLTIFAMVLLAVPFMFRLQRSTSLGRQVVLGFLIGIVFYIANRLMGQMGLVYDIPAALSASIPTLSILVAALWMFRRTQ